MSVGTTPPVEAGVNLQCTYERLLMDEEAVANIRAHLLADAKAQITMTDPTPPNG